MKKLETNVDFSCAMGKGLSVLDNRSIPLFVVNFVIFRKFYQHSYFPLYRTNVHQFNQFLPLNY